MPDPLPERFEGSGLLVRRWLEEDVETLERAVTESIEHLRPWMEWVVQEPMSLDARRRLILSWERDWRGGGDVTLGIFRDGAAVGGTGMHRRVGPSGLEIGYWVHPAFLHQGIAGGASALVTDAAFTVPAIEFVEIHHDKGNLASREVPAKLGFTLVSERHDGAQAPAEVGIECVWRMERDEWERRRAER
jgi:RimJ/RimL family protein N-acetyltransferase